MRNTIIEFICDHAPALANWLSLGVGLTNRRGGQGAGLGGGAAAGGESLPHFTVMFR